MKNRSQSATKSSSAKQGTSFRKWLLFQNTAGNPTYQLPEYCPSCHTKVVREEGEAAIYCPNIECPAQLMRNLNSLCFSKCDGYRRNGACGSGRTGQCRLGSFSSRPVRPYQQIASLERMGKKSASNLMNALEKSKQNDLSKVTFALGYSGSREN